MGWQKAAQAWPGIESWRYRGALMGSVTGASRTIGCWLLILVCLSLVAFEVQAAASGNGSENKHIQVPNPGAVLWREVRQRDGAVSGRTQVLRGTETGVLINRDGERFRDYRRGQFIRYAAYFLGGVVALLLLYFLLHGKVRIEGGESGRKLLRFELIDRIAHWLLALLFLFLAGTGLLLLFGRFIIIPWLGAEAFSPIASACKEGHNLFGPIFIAALLFFLVRFIARNIPKLVDLRWLLTAGGMIGGGHVRAGFFNAGEKIWFWLVVLFGLAIVGSGLILDFPSLLPQRTMLTLALVVHGLAAVVLFGVALGHIYMGSIGTEGTLEGMKNGYVDENWARTHHDLWLEKAAASVEDKGAEMSTESPGGVPEVTS